MAGCRLIVHADDLGQSVAINAGIARAHDEGILTSASIMPTGAAFDEAVTLCGARPALDVGVHLALVGEAPLVDPGSIPSLVDGRTGRLLPDYGAFLRRYLRGGISLADVRTELGAQLQAALERGLPVSHVDSHQHLHMLPGIHAAVAALARQHGLRAVRYPRERCRAFMLGPGRSLARLAQLAALNAVCLATPRRGLVATDRFAGFYYGGRLDSNKLGRLLRRLPRTGSCELMCHPGTEPDATPGGYDRPRELQALIDPAMRAILRDSGVTLISYRDLAAEAGS